MKTITIIRHAQSKFNAGECKTEAELRNSKLTTLGKIQASQLNQSFDLVILSPLKRAIETYANSNIKNSVLNFLENEDVVPESENEVKLRAQKAVDYLRSLPQNNIGIVSHGCFIWYLLEKAGQQPVATYNTQTITFNL
jgi:broad specificity phosphatase PhoE